MRILRLGFIAVLASVCVASSAFAQGGSAVISGTVKTFYQKQLAQEAVRSVAKEVTLINAVKVHGATPLSE